MCMCISPYFQVVTERTELRHGDRILWGNNHFFRINCPHHIAAGQQTTKTEEKKIDFDFAQVMVPTCSCSAILCYLYPIY